MDEPPPAGRVEPIPYASPAAFAAEGVWREGNRLVVTGPVGRTVHLPRRCVKCNAATDGRRGWTRTLYWHELGFYFLIPLCLLIYVLVAAAVQKRVTVHAALCPAHRTARRNRLLIGGSLYIIALGLIVLAVYLSDAPAWRRGPASSVAAVAGGGLLLFTTPWALFTTRVLTARRIVGPTTWLTGAGPEFLASLPEA